MVQESLVTASITATKKAVDGRKTPGIRSRTGILRSNAPEIGFLSTEELLGAMEPSTAKPLTALDGHPQYKWDQEVVLKLVFRKLDARRQGFLGIEDLTLLAQNTHLQELLRYTVFGFWVKKRMWKKFVNISDASDSSLPTKSLSPARSTGALLRSNDSFDNGNQAVAQPSRTISLQQVDSHLFLVFIYLLIVAIVDVGVGCSFL